MRLTKQIFLILLLATVSARASHEAKGGDPLKTRFREIGGFLTYHLDHHQVRLSARLEDFAKFKRTVPVVPLELVDQFPPGTLDEALTGQTVKDDTSPVGRKILIHRKRFQSAVDRFDRGEEVILIEGPFLSWCFHEFLLASGEKDEDYGISKLLSADKKEMEEWAKSQGPLLDQTIRVTLPYLLGPIVSASGDENADKASALQGYTTYYSTTGRALEDQKIAAVRELVNKKLPVIKVDNDMTRTPTPTAFYFRNTLQADQDRQRKAGVVYTAQRTAYFYLDTDKEVVRESTATLKGETYYYSEFPNSTYGGYPGLYFDQGGLLTAWQNAFNSLGAAIAQRLPELEKSYRDLYGDDFLFIDVGLIGETFPGCQTTWGWYHWGSEARQGCPSPGFQFEANPTVYRIKD